MRHGPRGQSGPTEERSDSGPLRAGQRYYGGLMQSGEVIDDRFELERLAGAGAMGEVWRARDRKGGSAVAVKLLSKVEEGWDARFMREALSLAQLDHPGIVRYIA